MRTIILICSLFVVCSLKAQINMSGKVVDKKGEPIFAATIYLYSNPQTGTSSNFDGLFELQIPDLNDTLVVSFLGFETQKIPLSAYKYGEPLIVTLLDTATTLTEVVIRADDPISKRYSVSKMTGFDIYFVPMSQGDPLKAITLLPSSTTTDESANPSLRGSSPYRSVVILNGVPINNPVKSSTINTTGMFSLFSPEIIDTQYVYASNPPLTYGNSSAGLVEIKTNKRVQNNQTQISLGLGGISGMVNQNFNNNKSLIQVFTNQMHSFALRGIQKSSFSTVDQFSSNDMGYNLHHSFAENVEVKSYAYVIREDFDGEYRALNFKGDMDYNSKRFFTVNNLFYYTKWGVITFNNGFDIQSSNIYYGNLQSQNRNRNLYNSINTKWFLSNKIELQSGFSFNYQQFNKNDTIAQYYFAMESTSPVMHVKDKIYNKIIEGYIYLNWDITSELSLSSGIRKNIPLSGQQNNLSYQLSVNYDLDRSNRLILSGGKYYNYSWPNYLNLYFNQLSSKQFSLDYMYRGEKNSLGAAFYYKKENGAQTIDSDLRIPMSSITIWGIEMSLEQELFKCIKVNLSNTYLRRSMQLDGVTYNKLGLDYLVKGSLVYNTASNLSLSLSYITRPGLRYTSVDSGVYRAEANDYQPVFDAKLYEKRYRNYHTVDFLISKYFSVKKSGLILYGSVNNLFNIKNQSEAIYNKDYTNKAFNFYQKRIIYFGLTWQFYRD